MSQLTDVKCPMSRHVKINSYTQQPRGQPRKNVTIIVESIYIDSLECTLVESVWP